MNSDKSGGYVRLFRKLLQNPIWTQLSPAVLKVAIYFLLRAGHKPVQWYDGSKTIDIPAGSFITSNAGTAAACNISTQQTRDAFSHLSRTHFATYERTRRWTLVTVLNWAAYQAQPGDGEHTKEQAGDRVKNTTETAKGTTNKNKRKKEVNICSSVDEPRTDLFSIDKPPFNTLDSTVDPGQDRTTEPAKWGGNEKQRAFLVFWTLYPRKKDKPEAERAFCRLATSPDEAGRITAALRAQLPELRVANEQSPRSVCPYASTWLNKRRFEDEPASPNHSDRVDGLEDGLQTSDEYWRRLEVQ